jgi:DNA-binding NtrC family response regulator
MSLQTRLLRVLETGTLRHLGGEESIRVDCRVLASTHRDLEARVEEGTFREDLYYRLNVFSIHIPPLRERVDDIPTLVDHFLARFCPGGSASVNPDAMKLLKGYSWPGNVRELRNVLERALILSGGVEVRPCDLPSSLSREAPPWDDGSDTAPLSLQEVERRYLKALMDRYGGDRGRVAAVLGISERTLYRKLRSLDGGVDAGS